MKVTANGVSFNCEIDGPEGAPWITFSNSLATNVSMWDDQKKILLDADDVRAKHGVAPGQMGDLIALMGDASDNSE